MLNYIIISTHILQIHIHLKSEQIQNGLLISMLLYSRAGDVWNVLLQYTIHINNNWCVSAKKGIEPQHIVPIEVPDKKQITDIPWQNKLHHLLSVSGGS